LTRTDGGKLAAASGQKSSSFRSSCSTSCCTQCHFDIEPFEVLPDATSAGSGAWHGADLKQAEIAHCAAHSEGDDASRQRQDVADREAEAAYAMQIVPGRKMVELKSGGRVLASSKAICGRPEALQFLPLVWRQRSTALISDVGEISQQSSTVPPTSSSSLAKFAAINKTRALGAKGRYRGGLAKRRTTNKRLVSRLAPTLDPLIVRGRMRRKRGSTGETVGRKMREPRAVRPGAPELIAHIRQVIA